MAPALTTPTPNVGTVLGTSNVAFTWTPGTGPTLYDFWLGTKGVGSDNVYVSGHITTTSATAPKVAGQRRYDLRAAVVPGRRHMALDRLHLHGTVAEPPGDKNHLEWCSPGVNYTGFAGASLSGSGEQRQRLPISWRNFSRSSGVMCCQRSLMR